LVAKRGCLTATTIKASSNGGRTGKVK
jgi:hypothetical protein